MFPLVATFYDHLLTAAGLGPGAPWVAGAVVAAGAALLAWVPRKRRRVGLALLLFIASAAGLVAAAALLADGASIDSAGYRWTRFVSLLLLAAAIINLASVLLFDVLLAVLRLRPPAIVSDLAVAIAYIAAAIGLLTSVGVNLAGIVATSAVVTAVIGFSLQDTLGNVIGGVAVQLDRSLAVGDWVRVGEHEGRISEIRWRYTAIETRNWDTVLVPNSLMTKTQVVVLGRRAGQPRQRRQAVLFNVDFRHSPTRVTELVEAALRAEPLPGVASDPAPNCVMMDFRDSWGVYAARYWLTDLAVNDPTDSVVRSRIYAALRRAGIPPSMPAQQLFVTEEDASRRDRKAQQEATRRVEALAGAEIFRPLTDDERSRLADRLRLAPFVRGETVMRQGARGDWMYILVSGAAEVRVASDDGRAATRLATLRPGDVFGEMGLMTGGERAATVVATADCTCYRVDKADLVDILEKRPPIAEAIARILATRKAELEAARENLNEQAKQQRLRTAQSDLVERIRRFFTLES